MTPKEALDKLRDSVRQENIRCVWKECAASAKETRIYFYRGGKETYCGKHLQRVDPDYKRMLDRSDLEAKQYSEAQRYGRVEFGSHKDSRRPALVCV